MSSRLFMHLREEQGLCYSISSSFSLSRMAGLWGVSSSTTPAQVPRFLDAYLDEARLLHKHGLNEIELAESVSRIRGLLELATNDPEYRMKRLARQYLFEGSTETVQQTLARLSVRGTVTLDSVNSLIQRELDQGSESVLLYGKLGARTLRTGEAVLGASLHQALYDQEESPARNRQDG